MKWYEKILGKRKSLQRKLAKELIIVFFILTSISISIFYVSVRNAMVDKLDGINIEVESIEGQEIESIITRSLFISTATFILFTCIIMRYTVKKILKPIKEINDATKQIARGDFDVELESEREDEIGELTQNFNVMAKDLNKIEVLQKDFINNMSHEIKTPISSIKGFAQLLESEDLTEEEKKEYIGIIVEESDRLLNISSNILKLSKLQNKEKLTNKTEVDISNQIKKVINILENKWGPKEITISSNLPKTIINGDEELLYQVWMNLLDNAIKFSNPRGNIDVNIRRVNDKAEISIKDDGIGMSKEEMQKIFQRFYQVDESHYSEGSGLGLAIVKKIVTLSDGDIKIESKKGNGSTFIVKLPIEKNKNKIKIK